MFAGASPGRRLGKVIPNSATNANSANSASAANSANPALSKIVDAWRTLVFFAGIVLGIQHQVVLVVLFRARGFSALALPLALSRFRRALDIEDLRRAEICLRRLHGLQRADPGNGSNFHLRFSIPAVFYRQNEAIL